MRGIKADDAISTLLRSFNEALAEHLKADVIVLKSPIRFGLDDAVRYVIENIPVAPAERKEKLVVILETTGGYIEVVERIYKVFRKHYSNVVFIVPNFAYSAGTVLALSGDEIYMDYYSVLGPIDPQYESGTGGVCSGDGLSRQVQSASGYGEQRSRP